MKKIRNIFLAATFVLAASGLSGCKAAEKSLYEQGLSVISLMHEITADKNYAKLWSSSFSDDNLIMKELREGNYSEPAAVYKLNSALSSKSFMSLLGGLDPSDLGDFSPRLMETMRKKMFTAIPSSWNGFKAGTQGLAAASMLSTAKVFDCRGMK